MSEQSKVRLWIWVGFILVLMLLAGVGMVSYFSFERTIDQFAQSSRIGASTMKAILADRNIASFRRYAAAYLTSGDERLLKRLDELNGEVLQDLDEALAGTSLTEARQSLERLRDLTKSFRARFDQAVALRAKKLALLGEVDGIGHQGRLALDAFTQAFRAEAVTALPQETLMRGRLDVLRFATHPTEDLRNRALELVTTTAKQVRGLATGQPPNRQEQITAIAAITDQMAPRFQDAAAVALELEKLSTEVMDAIGKEISATTNALRKLQTDRLAEINLGVNEDAAQAKMVVGALTGLAIAVGLLCAFMISRMVSRPITEMATAARVAEEIGELITVAAHDGDFRNRATVEGRTGFVATISTAVNQLFDSVCTAFQTIGHDAGQVALAASDASGAVVEVNAGAAEQARSLEQVRDAIRQSAEAITRVSGNAKTASAAALHATELARHGQTVVTAVAEVMETIARSGREVSQVTHALGQIATKTDILATTTAVEAARLGDDGRSFAVIAQQIGALAVHATTFSARIAELVEAANRDTQAGVATVGKARQVIDEIQRQVADTTAMIGEIAEAMLAQQSMIVEIDATANSLAQIGEHNLLASEQISRRLVQLRSLSATTQEAVARFKTEMA